VNFEPTDDPTLAKEAGVSLDAVQLLRSSEVIDLHIESFIPARLYSYDLTKRHGTGPSGGRRFGQLDFPRALDGGLTGGMWSITTNILRGAEARLRLIRENTIALRDTIESTAGKMRVVRDYAEYMAARKEGAHAAMIAIQGGNCFEAAPEGPAAVPGRYITRVTVVHLSNSCYGATSSPAKLFKSDEGLTEKGKEFVAQLDAERIFVDLAHIHRKGFWDAIDVHDRTLPVIDTHTGVCGVKDMWRNVDDDQVKAVAKTGGVVGIIFEPSFLTRPGGPDDGRMVVEHMKHIIDVAGEDTPAIGSDYDGFITPPPDLRDGGLGFVRLVQYMLDADFSEATIRKILGQNFLRSFAALRPGTRPGN
jgi:membrane dipeptidase